MIAQKGVALEHREWDVGPHDRPEIGAGVGTDSAVAVAGERGEIVVKQNCAVVGRDDALAEKDDRVTAGDDGQNGAKADGAIGASGEPDPQRGEMRLSVANGEESGEHDDEHEPGDAAKIA